MSTTKTNDITGVNAPLKSCPFCGALEAELRITDMGAISDMDGHAVTCECCGAIGPRDARQAAAVALWNGAALQYRKGGVVHVVPATGPAAMRVAA